MNLEEYEDLIDPEIMPLTFEQRIEHVESIVKSFQFGSLHTRYIASYFVDMIEKGYLKEVTIDRHDNGSLTVYYFYPESPFPHSFHMLKEWM